MASPDQLVGSLESLTPESFTTESERVRAWEQNWVNGATNASIKTLIDAGIFAKWIKIGGRPAKAGNLAELVNAVEILIKRMMRQISGQHLIVEVGEDKYATTPWVEKLVSDPAFPSMYGEFYKNLNVAMFRTLPYFLGENGFKNPTDVVSSNWQYMTGKSSSFFEDVGTNAELRNSFNDAIKCHSKYNLTPWPDVFPTDSLAQGAKPDGALVVDMGGGKGHDLTKFNVRHPDAPQGSLILQDVPDILKDMKPVGHISVQPHDFFQPQLVKGARAYFMHNVLHDWADPEVIQVLKNIPGAMETGYSLILVHESLISTLNPSPLVTVSDITVMACLSAKERTEKEWDKLFQEAGLRIIKIWKTVEAVESIIEAELA
ncbi:O-methyltransferase-domain-containing protein [Emericellopsis atlantica]|uniref:O-methyltransferase-domain-containing protein n=1 Tax=Emericellopsis atlantica TaxID=2614577 RepID=A0A9P7ZLN1_9HYPO|nr:O-methyltransferase-domain-containing protein [Emericellopsis atlantica]KAG9253971.1 O-methyltransferase-domain-containing protein [Emericellopsis atlantica]